MEKFSLVRRIIHKTLSVPLIITLLICILSSFSVQALDRNVYYFDIQDVRLNMKLDEVINKFSVNNVKTSKDKYGIANGYEIIKQVDEMKIVLNFTGKKRLYRIDYTNQYNMYRYRSTELYEKIKQKYGDPTIENIETANGENRTIRSCWGSTCTKLTPTTPALKAIVYWESGKIKLTLSDYRIFNQDWKKYKDEFRIRKGGGITPSDKENDGRTIDF